MAYNVSTNANPRCVVLRNLGMMKEKDDAPHYTMLHSLPTCGTD